ncbi:hypothetical protein [Amycolatopsis vastitatis]|uniref:Lipoprotein n=1 Tax=Amycolatopsis vastitatis TaxID=1905142 RepID=A0A229SP40_9PSEU|nr:hypothetical protein [Amycolatopsis vastitatis]OXM60805.1 hypothetical protein CF165_40900 [Amycolatopsis vastitatis]
MHSNEKKTRLRSAVAGTLLAGLALAGCGAEESPAAPAVTSRPPVPAPSTTAVQTRPIDLFRLYRVQSLSATMGTACSGHPAPTDTACGQQLDAIRRTTGGFLVTLAKAIPGTDFSKIREAADQLTKPIDLLQQLGCYGMGGPGKKPGKNEAGLCGTFGTLALLGWLSFETTVEQY